MYLAWETSETINFWILLSFASTFSESGDIKLSVFSNHIFTIHIARKRKPHNKPINLLNNTLAEIAFHAKNNVKASKKKTVLFFQPFDEIVEKNYVLACTSHFFLPDFLFLNLFWSHHENVASHAKQPVSSVGGPWETGAGLKQTA